MSVDGPASAITMLDFGTWRPGFCLEAVWQAYKRNGARTNRSAPTATVGWEESDGKHHGDRNPPAGVPVWWGPRRGSAAGDVVISLGNGKVVATDWPRNGVIGVCTIDQRERQIGRPYLGWTESIFDVPVDYPGKGGNVTPPTPAVSNEEDNTMLMLEMTAGKSGKHLVALGEGQTFTHFVPGDPYTKIMQISRAADDWQPIDISELPGFLEAYGCDKNIWDFRNAAGQSVSMNTPGAQFCVFDPLANTVKPGNTWTATSAVRKENADLRAALVKAGVIPA